MYSACYVFRTLAHGLLLLDFVYVLERALARAKRGPQLFGLKVASFSINLYKQEAVFEQPRKFGKSYVGVISSCGFNLHTCSRNRTNSHPRGAYFAHVFETAVGVMFHES